MADIKDKLERVKREREARARLKTKSDLIKDTWEKIDKSEELSIKEKLQRLISLSREQKPSKPAKPSQPLFEPQKREPLLLFENPYPLETRYGKITLSSGLQIKGDVLAWLSRDSAFEKLDLSSALFIDLETTGLSGGTGVIPFLIGLGYYRDDRFHVTQFFLGDLAEEERMIQEFGRFISQMNFQSIITFNGKGFDMPLLETRFILHRQPLSLSGLPHLDFLYSARSLWRHKHESCRLYHLSREVVQADRAEDIPAAEVPWRFFQYLQTGNFEVIEPVLYHNQEDILSLLGVIIVGSIIFSEAGEEGFADAMDLYGAGKVMENVGEVEKSVDFFKKALEGKLSEEISLQARRKLSTYFKKGENWERAVSLWREMTASERASLNQLYSFRELAMYFEHKMKKYEEALKVAEEGLVLSIGFSPFYEKDFSHRLERLKRKLKRS
jgi:uncharacterized protein YprB with RNaseH-like and TPR domain